MRQDYGGTSDDMVSVGRAIVEQLAALRVSVDAIGALIPVRQGMTIIAQGNLSFGSPTFDLLNIPAGYAYLFLQLQGLRMDTAAREVLLHGSEDNGVSFDTVAANYQVMSIASGVSPVLVAVGSFISPGNNILTTDAMFSNTQIAAYQSGERVAQTSSFSTAGGQRNTLSHWYGGTGAALNALRIAISGSGNFTAGSYILNGVA